MWPFKKKKTDDKNVIHIQLLMSHEDALKLFANLEKHNIELKCAHCGAEIYSKETPRLPRTKWEKFASWFGRLYYDWDCNIGGVHNEKVYCGDIGCTLHM